METNVNLGDKYFIDAKYEVDAERLKKAFLHLRSLCTKEKDPFDN